MRMNPSRFRLNIVGYLRFLFIFRWYFEVRISKRRTEIRDVPCVILVVVPSLDSSGPGVPRPRVPAYTGRSRVPHTWHPGSKTVDTSSCPTRGLLFTVGSISASRVLWLPAGPQTSHSTHPRLRPRRTPETRSRPLLGVQGALTCRPPVVPARGATGVPNFRRQCVGQILLLTTVAVPFR